MIRQLLKLNFASNGLLVRYYSPRMKTVKNPGIKRRMTLFQDEEIPNIQKIEDIDELESDFFNVDESYKQHTGEMRKYKDDIHTKMMGQKYFNEKLPNFLTWAEKEQIRHLYRDDPEEWNPQRLNESFPASVETIMKIVKAKWTPESPKRIEKHDQKVQEYWKLLKEEKLKLPGEIKNHLMKFTTRKFDPKLTAAFVPKIKKAHDFEKPEKTEFSNIITSCRGYIEKQQNNQNMIEGPSEKKLELEVNRMVQAPPDSDTYLIGKGQKSLSKDMTLSELIRNTKTKGKNKIPTIPENPSGTGEALENIQSKNTGIFRFKKLDEGNLVTLKPKDIKEPEIPDYIKIPRKFFKKGATYKVDDCFYDYDGEFLYRVPGITN